MKIWIRRQKAALFLKGAAIVALLAITAASISCTDPRRARFDSWKGHPIEELIQHMGPPTSTMQLKDGRMVYSWIQVYGSGRTYRSVFTTSKDGIIEGADYHDASVPKRAD
ncbi:MAG: hypothetical protein JRF15_12705 [Deltaproteobacteria bacterium]|jgi:hypothetical protein|nr:hypothetical protein [Deltaproteobacteria bacterium]